MDKFLKSLEDKGKHLEFIQGVINRIGQNSFIIKGWTITLTSALFALAARDSDQKFMVVAYFPTLIFWLLDSYYLYQETLFRRLYDYVRKQETVDYSLNTKPFDKGIRDWTNVVFSKTVVSFYGIILITLVIIFTLLSSAR